MANIEDAGIRGGFGSWPVLIVLLGLLGGATATRVAPQPAAVVASLAPVADARDEPFEAVGILQEFLTAPAGFDSSGHDDRQSQPGVQTLVCAARNRHVSVSFLIAMVPDYVDSNVSWTFDTNVDAIQRAAAADGYSLSRFALPDWPPVQPGQGDGARRTRRLHEREPGLVLFTKTRLRDKADNLLLDPEVDVLAVFVVSETPTNGIHERAFLKAADYIIKWQRVAWPRPGPAGSGERYTLRVLGPNYSGASPSLRRALDTLLAAHRDPPVNVRILSGTATGSTNLNLLTFKAGTTPVSFAATVRSDDAMLLALCQHLADRGGTGHVVLLVESNTGYGQGFLGRDRNGNRPDDSCETPIADALRLPFPLHVSRLRDAAEDRREAREPADAASVALDLHQDQLITDQLPSMTPELTSATVEMTLANILDTIRRERFEAVGILATDKRDHLFLSERILNEAPNTLLFSTEADIIYVRPEFRAFTRGALVASTYPLFNATQTITNGTLADAGRHQFPGSGQNLTTTSFRPRELRASTMRCSNISDKNRRCSTMRRRGH